MHDRTITRLALSAGMLVPAAHVGAATESAAAHDEAQHERFLYVATIAQSASDPDFVAVLGADPEHPDTVRSSTASTCPTWATSFTTSGTPPTSAA